jgi:hypothetical protein
MDGQDSHNRQQIRKRLEPFFEQIVDSVERMSEHADGVEFEDFEDRLDEQGDKLKHEACKIGLESCRLEADRVLIDGQEYYRCMSSEATYRDRWGKSRIERGLFRPKGEHNGATVSPMDVRAGIVAGSWTPGCARTVGEFIQELPAGRAVALSGLPYSTSSFKRLGARLGADWDNQRPECESVGLEVPDEACAISALVDRVSVLMREQEEFNWRMLWCGAVCLHDEDGNILKTLRYGAIPDRLDEAVRQPMGRDVDAILEQRPDLNRIALGDGGTDVCKLLDEMFPDWERRIDFMHLVGKVSKALGMWSGEHETTRTADEVMASWKLKLLNDDEAIEDIEEAIGRWANSENSSETDKAIHTALTYIDNHREQMRYGSVRQKGLPVGSGAIEATCKSLVALRMKRNGQSWSYSGAQAILNLRSLALSDRWEEAMDHLMSTYRQQVEPMPAQAA